MIELALVQPPLALAEVEGIAYFFGDGSLFCAPGTSGYILDPDSPDDMGPDYSGLNDDASATGTGPMTPEAFAAWLKAEGEAKP